MKSRAKNIDMCSGPLFINLLRFALPFMFTGLIQHLYNACDVIVVGRYAGQEALAGVGTTGSLTNLILKLILGLSGGVSVVLARAIGAKKEENIHKIVHTAISVSIIGGAIVSVFGIVFAEPLLSLIDVPQNVMPQAKIYMQIIFAGKIPSLIYNFGAAILRAKGDTKRPLYIVSVSGIINVVLNLFFVIVLGMEADGVALATVISQIFTAVAIIHILRNETDNTRLYLKKLKIEMNILADIAKIGIPTGMQGMIFSISNVLIQSSVNSFGATAIAGSAASSNIGSFFYVAVNTFFQASMNFVSQNMGAKNYKRINKIVVYCLIYEVIVGFLLTCITLLFGEFLLGIYAPDNAEAVRLGLKRLTIVGCTYGICGMMEVMAGALRGMGYSFSGMISSIVGVCGIRILWVLTVFRAIGTLESLFISFPLSWLGTFLLHTALFLYARKRVVTVEG